MKSFDRVFDILELFLETKGNEARLSEIARMSGLHISTARRIVKYLVERGYLEQKERWGKYSLGPKFSSFSGLVNGRAQLRDIAMPRLLELNQLSRETALLATKSGKSVFFREIVDNVNSIKIVPIQDAPLPLYCTSVGKIVLADMSEVEVEEYYKVSKLIPLTENTITDISHIKKQLELIAKENIVYDDQEFEIGIRSVASGIRDAQGSLVAIVSVLGSVTRLTTKKLSQVAPLVKDCALKISIDMGYNP